MKRLITPLFLVFIVFACNDINNDPLSPVDEPAPRFVDLATIARSNASGRSATGNYAILMAEYLTTGENAQMGNTVFFQNVGNKQLAGDFVPALSLDGTTDVTYYADENRPSADISVATSTAAIDRAWQLGMALPALTLE